ncbi:hypothetical protein F2Q69_00040319 [Brassica cretica]|uniref:Uncharacterized protein n=1 Tax=Brassica cretica TaxID=69181 RepID=A0A8S9NLT8_BRACR|nr:hypothetical protein F2Q69_00040319 [Brassica cretica]
MGKYLVKLGNVDFLDTHRLGETAPLGRWDTRSGFLASSSGRCDKYVCGMEWGISPAASAYRCKRPLQHLVSVSRTLAAASRWGHKATGSVTRPLGHLGTRLIHYSCL